MARRRLGDVLLSQGAISQAQLQEGLAHHRQMRLRLGAALVQKGFLTEEALARALSEALGIPLVDAGEARVEWAAVHLLRASICEAHGVFPVGFDSIRGRRMLRLAMVDPLDLAAVEEVEFTTGVGVAPRLATYSSVHRAIRRWYHRETDPVVPGADPEEEVIEGEEVASPPSPPPVRSVALSGSPLLDDEPPDFFEPDEDDRKWERRFWALARLLVRKGVITQGELKAALGELE